MISPGPELDNTTILITGASRGIGRELAFTLAGAGAGVGLLARSAESLNQVVQEITSRGGRAVAMPTDLARAAGVAAAVKQVREIFGYIDVLVNAAGLQVPIGAFWECDWEEWEHNIQVNLLGTARMIKSILPMMMDRRQGKIINFSGGGATAPRPYFSAYATSKAALVRLTETLAVELESYNIQVNAVAPGAVNTQMLNEIIEAGEKAGAEYHHAQERARSGGTPVEMVCELVKFLASPASGSLTGKLISAPHDPWREWAGRADDLNATPLYTLRRLDPHTLKPLFQDLANLFVKIQPD